MGALDGLKVLDLTTKVSGPVAAMMLADQGARVIKVEPTSGEQMRHIGSKHNDITPAFFSCNRGKESIALDLKSDAGKDILLKLAKDADVFIQNFRPGAIDRMGFGEEVLRRANERLIYVSISGFGDQGPYADKRVYDPIIQALSGATDIQADRVTGKPNMFRIILADKVTALTAAQAISSALYAREKSGRGQHIRLSMLDTMLSFFWPEGMGGLTYAEREFDPKQAGMAAVTVDCGIHALHMACYVTGQNVTKVSSDFAHGIKSRELEDDNLSAFRMSGGAIGRLWTSGLAIGRTHGLTLQVFGEIGGLSWQQEHPNQLRWTPLNAPTQILERGAVGLSEAAARANRITVGHPEGMVLAFANVYRDLSEVIGAQNSGTSPDPLALTYPTAEEGCHSIEVVEVMVKSAKNDGEWMTV